MVAGCRTAIFSNPRRLAAAIVAGGCLALALLVPTLPCQAGSRPSRSSRSRQYEQDRLRLEQERLRLEQDRLQSREEEKREAGRVKRRDELEKNKKTTAQERESYYGTILQTSEAALNAPSGLYYRKPGFKSVEPPGGQPVVVGGVTYWYESGIFWLQKGPSYIVVTAPVGAVVDRLPTGCQKVESGGNAFDYYFGTFFLERDGVVTVVHPPAGVSVTYLPDGYTREQVDNASYYHFGDLAFVPVTEQGIPSFKTVTRPARGAEEAQAPPRTTK